jgi:hypothetical protein
MCKKFLCDSIYIYHKHNYIVIVNGYKKILLWVWPKELNLYI